MYGIIGKSFTSNDIVEKLDKWHKNTIKTFIERLLSKGFIKHINKIGKLYVYVPTITEYDYQKEQLQHFVDTVLRGDKNKLKLLGE